MSQLTWRVRRSRRAFFYSQLLIAFVGASMSVVLHELFHLIVHWGHVSEISLLSDHAALVTITSQTSLGYNPQLEEMVAYGITMLTMLVTVAIICYRNDKRDTRSFTETVFPRNKTMQQLSNHELYELATRVHLV